MHLDAKLAGSILQLPRKDRIPRIGSLEQRNESGRLRAHLLKKTEALYQEFATHDGHAGDHPAQAFKSLTWTQIERAESNPLSKLIAEVIEVSRKRQEQGCLGRAPNRETSLRGPNSVPWGTAILKHLRQILGRPFTGRTQP